MNVDIGVYNANGEKVASDTSLTNGKGLTLSNLVGGTSYELRLYQRSGLGDYKLLVGYQKATADITGYTLVSDSLQFADQYNRYDFVPAVTGRHVFAVQGMSTNAQVDIRVHDENNEVVVSGTYLKNGNYVYASLEAGKVYRILFYQRSGVTPYQLAIGHKKPVLDLSAFTTVKDSMQYAAQSNSYTFTASDEKKYKLELVGMPTGMDVAFTIINQRGETLVNGDRFSNGRSLSFSTQAGDVFEIILRQNSGTGAYTLNIE